MFTRTRRSNAKGERSVLRSRPSFRGLENQERGVPANFFFRCFQIPTASSYRGLEPVIPSSGHPGVSSFRKSHAGSSGTLGEDDLLSAEAIQTLVSRSALAPRN